MRVLATQTAERTAQDLRATLQTLQEDARRVLNLGDRLADTSLWDGPVASEFRQVHWPKARASLQPTLQTLERLQASAQTVVDNILKAGGGDVAGAGPGGEGDNQGPLGWAKSTIVDPLEAAFDLTNRGVAAFTAGRAVEGMAGYGGELAYRWQDINELGLLYDRGQLSLGELASRAQGVLNARDAAMAFSKNDLMGGLRGMFTAAPKEGSLLDTASKFMGPLAIGADAYTFGNPEKGALGGPDVEKWMSAGNAVGVGMTLVPSAASLIGINAVADWIPGVGEVVAGGTAAYMLGDLIYQNREVIGHAFESAASGVAHVSEDVASTAWKGIDSGWHAFTSIF